jgi:hypothetical protein
MSKKELRTLNYSSNTKAVELYEVLNNGDDSLIIGVQYNPNLIMQTTCRIELLDNDYLDLSLSELKDLRTLLNSEEFKKLIGEKDATDLVVNNVYLVEGVTVTNIGVKNMTLTYRGKLGYNKYVFSQDGTGREYIFTKGNFKATREE